ncbi:Soluble ligand binding domain protein [Cellulomonas fimi ATCC 484]|uniref:Soluble ligand binding domain protein n=1 Tax=Cellulomonas fimi (strain ATCC 484 / DSM 20113 / JCM 1341 / CCUG 24087 / LMG 16345 / NBRC 15513 / NCIMB 8980 / NCTC 7547 / NRS-133) TaxID=590998 RepID=F4H3F3_CELFA|nr:Soluble ligand binding domain protein [Cellulomonas fimi ATCC 484]VEH33232.1 ComE operon protein 1 [Cellulomonas fimi]
MRLHPTDEPDAARERRGQGWRPVPAAAAAGEGREAPADRDVPQDAEARPAALSVPDARLALERVRDEYADAYGHPLARTDPRRARPRWAPSWRAAAAAGTVVLLLAGAVALRASTRPSGEAVVLPEPTAPALAAPGPTGSGARPPDAAPAPTPAPVLVHVVGAVSAPGLVELDAGARVADALSAAGGTSADADLALLNLARVLVDGEQVVVPRVGEAPAPAASGSAPAAPGLVDLNTADAAALDGLPGIGPVLAQRIVEHRSDAPFTSVDDLADVRGIGPALLDQLRDLVRV